MSRLLKSRLPGVDLCPFRTCSSWTGYNVDQKERCTTIFKLIVIKKGKKDFKLYFLIIPQIHELSKYRKKKKLFLNRFKRSDEEDTCRTIARVSWSRHRRTLRRSISLAFRQRQMLPPPAARHREFDRRNMDTVAVVSVVKVSRGVHRVKYQIREKRLITKLHNDAMVDEHVHARDHGARYA